ncbi:MAG: FAD-dependent oxidoreductase [Hyphomicrobiales bacterium]|nr:FAD-dependent oxidoreductase [Hyphomicrobiales bacterium]
MSASASNVPATQVLIVGGGPCGLMLANELGRRGIMTILVDQKASTAFSPQANATQARSMEHFRRLGFADEIRRMGLPDDYPTDIAYFTRYTRHEIGRVNLPSSRQAAEMIKTLGGSWSAAELPHRVSQKFVEAVLYRHAAELPSVSLDFNWRVVGLRQDPDGVEADVVHTSSNAERRIRARYLVGADGPRSIVRSHLGIDYGGEAGASRDFMGGRMLAVYLKAPTFYEACRHPKAWMYTTFNAERRALLIAVDGKDEFVFHTQLRPDENAEAITDAVALDYLRQAIGRSIPVEILARDFWLAGRTLVAERFQNGRMLLGGDAVHLFTPTGGMGYNTAIEDAVNMGWKLAAVLKGQAPATLLDSYEAERRPVARRNTGFARHFADSIGLYLPSPALEADGRAGDAARRRAGEYLANHARAEFNIPGFTFGARYDGSPIIASEATLSPPDQPNAYVPTGKPGGRAPHVWLPDGRSLYDAFGFEWTLLSMGADPAFVARFTAAWRAAGLDLSVVTISDEEASDLYESDLVLIRPDQIVAWRRTGDSFDPAAVLALVTGRSRRAVA